MIYKKFVSLSKDYKRNGRVEFEDREFYATFINCYYNRFSDIVVNMRDTSLYLKGKGTGNVVCKLSCEFIHFLCVIIKYCSDNELLLEHVCCYKLIQLGQPINIVRLKKLIKEHLV